MNNEAFERDDLLGKNPNRKRALSGLPEQKSVCKRSPQEAADDLFILKGDSL